MDDSSLLSAVAMQPKTNLSTRVSSNDLAYIIYTSGTTGKPKGVMIEHKNVVNFIYALLFRQKVALNATFTASYLFDVSTFDLWSNLLFGHSLFVVKPALLTSQDDFKRFIVSNAINKLYLPANLLQFHLDSLKGNSAIKQLLTGVESLPKATLDLLSANTHIVNGYGPTEATTCATLYDFNYSNHDCAIVPIGKPMANTQTYILDKYLNFLPIGAVGELYIGGDGLARNYLNLPELSLTNFIANPFQTKVEKYCRKNARLYKTGDLVRYLPDGNIQYIGRADAQIKLHGYRIELAEIEIALSSYPAVKQAAAGVKKQNGGQHNEALIGYYASDEVVDENKLMQHLHNQLPHYMAPTILVRIDYLPLTTNGKLDRTALALLAYPAKPAYVAPAQPVEKQLATIWQTLLNLTTVGIHDNFFELGGHSLLALQLIQRIEQLFGTVLPVSTIFTHPTICELAALCDYPDQPELISVQKDEEGSNVERIGVKHQLNYPLIPLKPTGNRPPLFVVHPLGGNLLSYQAFSQHLPASQPLYGLQQVAIETSIVAMATTYKAAMEEKHPADSYQLVGWSMGGVIAHEIAYQLEQAGYRVDFLALIDSFCPRPESKLSVLSLTSTAPVSSSVLQLFCDDLWHSRGQVCMLSAEDLDKSNLMLQLEIVLLAAQSSNLLSTQTTTDDLLRMLQQAYSNLQLLYDHRPKPVKCPLVFFQASSPGKMPHYATDWQQYTQGSFTINEMAGDHYSILQTPTVIDLATKLVSCFPV